MLKRRKFLRTEQLALYVHAMVVACINPRDFYRHDLVSELRKRVNLNKYTNPLAFLVLCNAGAHMTVDDVHRLNRTFYSKHRPFWTDVQVISTMALSCISSKTNVPVKKNMLTEWVSTISMLQDSNGTINNPRTTALAIQMMLGVREYSGFNWRKAIRAIQVPPFFKSSNFLDKYYLIPVLSNKSPTKIDASHCPDMPNNADLFRKLHERWNTVYYSVWMETDVNFGRSWRVRVSMSSSLYDVIGNVQRLDSTHFVAYTMVSGKPYVRSVSGISEDPETDHYWFTYERMYGSTEEPKLLEDSIKDIKTRNNQELILWYRKGPWNLDLYGSGLGSGEIP